MLFTLVFLTSVGAADETRDLRLGDGLFSRTLYDRAIEPLERVRSGDPTPPQLERSGAFSERR